VFETCQLVIDRPQFGDPSAFVYVAESVVPNSKASVATSPVFHPEADPTSHRVALAQLEALLRASGWEREPGRQRALIGARYHRWRAQRPA
jgi:hypothetical protein